MKDRQTKRLGDITTLVKGKKPKLFTKTKGKPYLTARVVRGTDVPDLVDNDCPVSVWVKPEDIVIIMDGSNSGEMFSGLDGALASTMGVIKFDEELLEPRYLYSFLVTHRENFTKSRTGTAIPHLNKEGFENLEIPIPSLAEQKKIVKMIDEAVGKITRAKENTEKNLQNSKDLFDGYLLNILNDPKWEVVQLGDVCEKVEYGTSAKSAPNGDVPVLRMGNIQNGKFDWSNLVYTNDKKEIEKYLLHHNDVLFNRTNSPELVGKTAIYKSETPAIFAGYLIRIHRKKELLDADYLNYFLNSKIATEYGRTVVISSVHQANINGQKLKSYPIPLPSLSEQTKIVKKLDLLSEQTKKLESNYKQKTADLNELKKSLLTKAFAGEL